MTQPCATLPAHDPSPLSRKATQDGTCQLCGARQRLPGGRLAQHGYRVVYGQFNGVCGGSDQPAFEQSRGGLGEHLEALRREEVRQQERLARLQGPAPQLTGYAECYDPGSFRMKRHWGTLSHGTHQGKPALLVTDEAGVSRVAQTQRRPDFPLTGLQAYADQCRADQRRSAESELQSLGRYLLRQQRRYDGWAPAPPLPLTGSAEERAARADRPQQPTKQQQAEAKFRAAFRQKHGREPLWPSHQTTNNNPALLEFSFLMSHVSRGGQYVGDAALKPFTKAASQVMNLCGMDAFLEWMGTLLGAAVIWDTRAREFCTAAGARAFAVEDYAGSAQAAQAIFHKPPPALPDLP